MSASDERFPRSYVEALRAESAAHRVRGLELQERLDELQSDRQRRDAELGEILGMTVTDENRAEALQVAAERIVAAKNEIRELTTNRVLAEACRTVGADPETTIAVLKVRGLLERFDPADPSAKASAEHAVRGLVRDHPALRTGTGSWTARTQPDTRQVSHRQLGAMTPEAIEKARAEGLLDDLLRHG